MKKYQDLHLLPYVMAKKVCATPYTGQETTAQHRASKRHIAEIERRRREMTKDEIRRFCERVDEKCRKFYEYEEDNFFKRCVSAEGNAGRDEMLTVWIPHFLASDLAKKYPRIFV